MNKIKKFFAVSLVTLMLALPLGAFANAAPVDKDTIQYYLELIGIDDFSPEGIREAINKITSGGLGTIIDFIGGGNILKELQEYLNAFEQPSTTQETTTEEETTEETTTEEPTTEEPTTNPPVTNPPTNNYTQNYYPPVYIEPTTLPPQTTTFVYIPPEQIYTEPFTTTVFNPIVEEDDNNLQNDDGINFGTIIGLVLLVGSGVGVFVIVLALKRNRI